eukprot:TRINITY_DN1380_c0_g3_i1.p1 TRINITY_DN1380_c0_g3~~TRINITY_DN1380_c0_g3_i1.p1  ORF type:complete len:425 (+),score=77.70 TRINITY_DN1380_c0_g3_i1:70-1275(+)
MTKAFCDEIIALVASADDGDQDCEMLTLRDDSEEAQLLRRKIAVLRAEKQTLERDLAGLEEDLQILEDGRRAREASNMSNALALLRRHFDEFREKQDAATREIERLREIVDRTSDVCLDEKRSAEVWRDKYRQTNEQLVALRKQAAAANITPPLTVPGIGVEVVPDETTGAKVSNLFANGTAAACGVRVGDVIVEACGKTVVSPENLLRISVTHPGEDMTVSLVRHTSEGRRQTLWKTISPSSVAASPANARAASPAKLRFLRNATSEGQRSNKSEASEERKVAEGRKLSLSGFSNSSHDKRVSVSPPPCLDPTKVVLQSSLVGDSASPSAASALSGHSPSHADVKSAATTDGPREKPVIPKLPLHIFPQNNIQTTHATKHHAKTNGVHTRKVVRAAHVKK